MTVSKVKHFQSWLFEREKKHQSNAKRQERILKQELYHLKKKPLI